MAKRSKKFQLKRRYKIIIGIIAALIIFRLFLPEIVLRYANNTLAEIPGYYGHIEDIDISLYRGAYQIDSIYIDKKDSVSGKQTDFFRASMIDLSIEWKALFKGSLVGELIINSPKLYFTKNKTEIDDIKKDTADFRKVLKDLMPLRVNRFEVNNGSVHYIDATARPKVDIALRKSYILAQNLTNAIDNKTKLPSSVIARAQAYGGTVSFNMKLNALAERATFDLNAEVKNTNLVLLNDFLKAYANVDVNKGTFGLYTEFAALNGKYKGYVKPVIKDLDVFGPEDRSDNFFHKVWEGLVGGAGKILKNQKKDQIATRVPIEGDFGGAQTDITEMIWELLRNAFIQALMPSIDNQISLSSVATEKEKDDRGLLKRIFSGKKDKDKKDKD
ncbi:MAG: DUF748 domain-containing protein [Chitinophagaceae bacterium]|nr:DUF748 domain-containing protein [Chitinophagaceae bacterium]